MRALGVPVETVRRALASFRVDRHRTEPVALADGVLWVDDSKATNPHAADASLRAFERVVWIVGGLLKGVDLAPLVALHVEPAAGRRRHRRRPLNPWSKHSSDTRPHVPVFEVDPTEDEEVMPQAVRLAAAVAQSGDVVLLAPAAASMDQFTDYADRGERFAEAVHEHTEGAVDDHDARPGAEPTGPLATGPSSSGERSPA